jgi:tetratricopeptide (TPR) repeat protein
MKAMRLLPSFALFLALACGAAAQEAAPVPQPACYPDKPVDEYVAELQKRTKGTRNPLPSNICIFGRCSNTGIGPEERPREEPPPPARPPQPAPEAPAANESSSKESTADLRGALPAASDYDPIQAAHNVDVGDYYYRQKNYRAAAMRYSDALPQKPGDAAIHLRLGRALEKLKAPEPAYLEYDAVVKLAPEGKGADEARQAMERLAPELQRAGIAPATLSRMNDPEPAPCLPPPAPDSKRR